MNMEANVMKLNAEKFYKVTYVSYFGRNDFIVQYVGVAFMLR